MATGNAKQVLTAQAVASMSPQHVAQLLQSKAATIATLQHQLEWFKRQLFGKKSERFAPEPDPLQMHPGQMLEDLALRWAGRTGRLHRAQADARGH